LASALAANVAVHRDHLREAERDVALGVLAPEQAEAARQETQHRVLEDTLGSDTAVAAKAARRTALALALLLPLASVLTYQQLGTPAAIEPQAPPPAPAGGNGHGVTPQQVQQMAASLAERLQAAPDNLEGWLMLARSYTMLGRYADAGTAFRRAQALAPKDPAILADLADVTGMAQGRRLAGEPARLVQAALDLDPRHPKALALAGSVAYEAGDAAAARGYWERLAAVVPPDSGPGRAAQRNLADVARLEAGTATTGGPTAAASAAAAPGATVSGRVQLSPALVSRLAGGETLFVYDRAAQGPRMPLAVLRVPASAAALDFKLDDSMAMSPQLRLSGYAQVVIGARISRSGSATPQSGDLIGQSGPLAPGAQGVQVLIDGVQP
jgi:cytochrome c-type biogenesis protein CcmH